MTFVASSTLIALSLFGAGCSSSNNSPQTSPIGQVMINDNDAQKQVLPTNFTRREVSYQDGRKVSWIVISLKSEDWVWSLANDPTQPKSVKAWREMLDANLVINGSYFDESYQPAGFYAGQNVTNAKAWPDREQQNNPSSYSGLIKLDDGKLELAHLTSNPQEKPANDKHAFLTYPTLIANGKSLVKEDSKKYARRTILAQDIEGLTYIIITESSTASLYEAAEWLEDQPEKFQIAVNLDGGPSTGISYKLHDDSFDIPSAPIPNVVMVKYGL